MSGEWHTVTLVVRVQPGTQERDVAQEVLRRVEEPTEDGVDLAAVFVLAGNRERRA